MCFQQIHLSVNAVWIFRTAPSFAIRLLVVNNHDERNDILKYCGFFLWFLNSRASLTHLSSKGLEIHPYSSVVNCLFLLKCFNGYFLSEIFSSTFLFFYISFLFCVLFFNIEHLIKVLLIKINKKLILLMHFKYSI